MGSKSQLAFIYNMSVTFWAAVGPGFKMASPQLPAHRVRAHGARIVRDLDEFVTKFIKEGVLQLSGSRICVAAVSVETRALETDRTIAIDRVEPCTHKSAVQPVSPLSRSSHDQPLEVCCRQRRHSGQGFCSFSRKTGLGTNYYSRDWLARKNINRNVNAHRCTQLYAPREYTYG